MHLGGLLSTQEARVFASFVLSNLPRASITRWLHAARLHFLNRKQDAKILALRGLRCVTIALDQKPEFCVTRTLRIFLKLSSLRN